MLAAGQLPRVCVMEDYPFVLGNYSRPVTCAVPEAQVWFDRGIVWVFGFHHEEAIACFERALAADPSCPMAHWGVALCNGPNYNFHADNGYYGLSAQENGYPSMKCAFEAVTAAATTLKALQAQPQEEKGVGEGGGGAATEVERDLIEALQLRYAWPVTQFAPELQLPYANAMRAVHAKHADDPDVAFVFADSLMVLHPWKLWNLQTGEGVALVPELWEVLERALARHPEHPGLCHLWIHMLEMAPQPGACVRIG